MKISLDALANMIDHTNLKPYADREMMTVLCKEAHDNQFKMVAINSAQTKLCAELLNDSPVHVGAAISFPLGQTSLKCKIFETQDAISEGADEIDYVVNISALKNKNFTYVQEEMKSIVEICRENNVISKVIFENCYLTREEKIFLAETALRIKPDFIKTSTGFGSSGAAIEDVALMKSIVKEEVKVKAAGGIRNLKTALAMIEAGAERLGTSSGITIMEEYKSVNK